MRAGFLGGALVAERRVRVEPVEVDTFDLRTECGFNLALALGDHGGKHFRLHLHVPGVVEFAGFENGAGCRRCITTALERHGSEGRLGGIAVVRVGDICHHVVRLEFLDDEWAGADGAKVGRGAARSLGTDAILELRLLDDRLLGADEGAVGVVFRLGEGDLDGVGIGRLDALDAFELGFLRAAAIGRGAILPGEDHVFGGEGRAVRPLDVGLQLPGDARHVLGHAAIIDGRDFGDEPGLQRAGLVIAGERLDRQRGAVNFFGAAGKVGIEGGNGLPEQDFQIAVSCASGIGDRSGQRQRGGCACQKNGEFLHMISP